ncbi:MAG: response regulator transcription factor [Ruminococcus sp.]|jgi:DNA-binding response OmpR family regulator|nr:response regulator transcription factor [Ruminococcus sp.]
MNKKVLVCEDEAVIRDFVVLNLQRWGYDVTDVANGEDAVKAFDAANGDFEIALLDVMLPGMDGFSVCEYLRRHSSAIGIIMLSAKSQEMDKVNGLMKGADDYMTKPFSPSELNARVDALYRRVTISAQKAEDESGIITSGPFVLNGRSRTITKDGAPIELTQVEYQIMEYFLNNQDTALDRSSILNHIWGDNYYGDDKIVDVNIRRIRMKIEDEPSNPKYITTIWGFGYKWASR